jgi:hypothetical protein
VGVPLSQGPCSPTVVRQVSLQASSQPPLTLRGLASSRVAALRTALVRVGAECHGSIDAAGWTATTAHGWRCCFAARESESLMCRWLLVVYHYLGRLSAHLLWSSAGSAECVFGDALHAWVRLVPSGWAVLRGGAGPVYACCATFLPSVRCRLVHTYLGCLAVAVDCIGRDVSPLTKTLYLTDL